MPKATIMLALIKEQLNNPRLLDDCVYFDEKNGLRAANRIKQDLRKIRDMSHLMYKEVLKTQKNIKISHGRKVDPDRGKGSKKNVRKNPFKKLSDS